MTGQLSGQAALIARAGTYRIFASHCTHRKRDTLPNRKISQVVTVLEAIAYLVRCVLMQPYSFLHRETRIESMSPTLDPSELAVEGAQAMRAKASFEAQLL